VSSTTVTGPCNRDGTRGWRAKSFMSVRFGCGMKNGSKASSTVCATFQLVVVNVVTATRRLTERTPVGSAGRTCSAVSSRTLSLVALVPRITAILKSPAPSMRMR